MKLIIEIPDERYEWFRKNIKNPDKNSTVGAVALGVPYEDRPHGEWIPLHFDIDSKCVSDFPNEMDGKLVIVTDGKRVSFERIKKDAYDHFFPYGTFFELEDVVAWMPLPEPYQKEGEAE